MAVRLLSNVCKPAENLAAKSSGVGLLGVNSWLAEGPATIYSESVFTDRATSSIFADPGKIDLC